MVAEVTFTRSAGHRSRSNSAQNLHRSGSNDLNLPERARYLSPSECCDFCDLHHAREMTHNKHREIEAWRTDVNRNMANASKASSRSKKIEENKKKYKLIYLKYSPPGTPDKDPGFRRLPQNYGAQTDRKHNWHGELDIDSLSTELGSISLDVGDRTASGREAHSAKESMTTRSTKTTKTSASAKSDATCISDSTEFSRSNSNRLLNYLTIDDYKYRYGSTYSKVTNDLGNISLPNGRDPTLKRTDSAASRSRQSQRGGSAINSGYNLNSDVTLDLHSNLGSKADYQNETLEKAFQIVMGSKKPVNNAAHPHLYPQPKPAPPQSKHSKRFNRLHKALHKWMEDEILRPHSMKMTSSSSPKPLSNFSQMMDSPSWMEGAPDRAYSSSRKSSSRRKRRPQSSGNNDSGIINEDPESYPDKKDNNGFLEMLMEMEDSTNDVSFESNGSLAEAATSQR